MPRTALAQLAKYGWKLLEDYGQQPLPIFNEIGLDINLINSPDARINSQTADALWTKVAAQIDDPCCGLTVVKHWHPSSFGALGYAWLASTSLRTAFRRFERYMDTVSQYTEVEIHESGDEFIATFHNSPPVKYIPVRIDALMAVFMEMCRINADKTLNPLRVLLAHEEYPCSGRYYEYYRCPVEFNAKTDSLIFSVTDIDRKLDGANPQLANLNDQVMVKALAKLNRNDVEQQVKAVIIEQLPSGHVSQESIADELHMSVRNLQRKLQLANTSFREVMEQTRQELAKQYVKSSEVNLSEIAYLLGFAESSSFSRAYKRWFGQTPSQARQHTN